MKAGVRRTWKKEQGIYYFDSERGAGSRDLARLLQMMIREVMQEQRKEGVLVLCIGTDRSTGDSLGPLTGHKLKRKSDRFFPVIGTLERPVHAMNLERSVEMIRACYPDHLVLAVDASVGSHDHVGCVTIGKGSLRPGLGVCKNLQEVGDIFITGIVGGYGSYDPLMLQSVRLSVVMRMADYICESVHLVEQFFDRSAMV